MSFCKECVFCGEIAERRQEACGMYEDPVDAVKACVAAHIGAACAKKMTREDVRDMVRELELLKKHRDEKKAMLETVQSIIAGMLKEREENEDSI